jgi:predicted RNA-binding Zn ribbon-like protein
MLRFRFGLGSPWIDFTATLGARLADEPVERLGTAADLTRWAREAGLSDRASASDDELATAIAMREQIYRVAEAVRTGAPPDEAEVAEINAWAARPSLAPQLRSPGALGWAGEGTIEEVLALVARDAVTLFASPERERLRICGDEHCGALFVDLSRPGNRRWCSMSTCGNRAKKAAFHARRADGQGDS